MSAESLGGRHPRNTTIPLEPSFLQEHGREATNQALRRIVCSVKFELTQGANAFRLLGPEMSYHDVDPHLGGGLAKFDSLTPVCKSGNVAVYSTDSIGTQAPAPAGG